MQLPDNRTLAKIWAEVPPDYYFQLTYPQRLWHEWKWIILKHLATLEGFTPHSILEVGSSSGHLSELLQKLYPHAKVTGVDVYAPAIKEAKRRYPEMTFIVADAQKLPFKSKSFDLVVSSETIEHVVDPAQMLREIKRVLAPNGRAIVEMDSGSALFRLIWFFWVRFGKGRVWKRAHLHPFSSNALEQLILSENFTIEKKVFSHFGMAVSFLLSTSNNHHS